MIEEAGINKLREKLRGRLIQRSDADYDEARKLYNGMIDKRPRLIARCADVADVIAAVNFGRDQGLKIAIRGGGHNGPGLASVDDGLAIDMSVMRGVRVDPAARTVRVGAGCTQGDVDHATHAFGLAVPAGIISTTGIAGLTLSGGHGYLSRKYGLTIDNLIEADAVLADGSFVTASKDQNPDLFWALRGDNFGVVTSFKFALHPVSNVFAGPIAFDQKQARSIMQHYRDFLPRAPEELGIFLGLKTVLSSAPFPQKLWGKSFCLLMCCYDGSEDKGKAALRRRRQTIVPMDGSAGSIAGSTMRCCRAMRSPPRGRMSTSRHGRDANRLPRRSGRANSCCRAPLRHRRHATSSRSAACDHRPIRQSDRSLLTVEHSGDSFIIDPRGEV